MTESAKSAVRKIPPELTDDTNSTTTELQFEYFALSQHCRNEKKCGDFHLMSRHLL